jgi:hypothetical protein
VPKVSLLEVVILWLPAIEIAWVEVSCETLLPSLALIGFLLSRAASDLSSDSVKAWVLLGRMNASFSAWSRSGIRRHPFFRRSGVDYLHNFRIPDTIHALKLVSPREIGRAQLVPCCQSCLVEESCYWLRIMNGEEALQSTEMAGVDQKLQA